MGLEGRQRQQLGHLFLGLGRGNAEGALDRVGRRGQRHLGRQALVRHVGTQDVLQLDHVRGRLDVIEVQLGDPVDVLEDPRELARHALDLLLGEAEAGQLCHVQYLLSLDHGGRF